MATCSWTGTAEEHWVQQTTTRQCQVGTVWDPFVCWDTVWTQQCDRSLHCGVYDSSPEACGLLLSLLAGFQQARSPPAWSTPELWGRPESGEDTRPSSATQFPLDETRSTPPEGLAGAGSAAAEVNIHQVSEVLALVQHCLVGLSMQKKLPHYLEECLNSCVQDSGVRSGCWWTSVAQAGPA